MKLDTTKPVKIPAPRLEDIEWTQRAQNVMAQAQVKDIFDLLKMGRGDFLKLRQCGVRTIREFNAAFLQKFLIKPPFLTRLTFNDCSCFVRHDEPDWAILAGPYCPDERGQLEAAIAMLHGHREWRVSRTEAGVWLHVHKTQYTELGEE